MNRKANSIDPDEMACYEPSYLALHCLQKYLLVYMSERDHIDSAFNLYHCLGKFSSQHIDNVFLIFSRKQVLHLTFPK